jgi:phosphonate transport system substrate-binding protein
VSRPSARLSSFRAKARAITDVCPPTLRLADTGIEGAAELERAFAPFAEKFTELTGIAMEFYPVSDRTAAAVALEFDSVDLVLAGPSEYVIIASRQPVEIVWGLERAEYGTRFAVPADSEVQSLEDLRGKRIALGSVASTTNHITPAWMLVQAGLDLDEDVELVMAGDTRVQAFISGDVDALGGGYRDLDLIPQMAPDFEFRVIADSGTMPRDPFIARAGLGEECIAAIRDVVQANEEALFEAFIAPAADEGVDEAQERSKYLGARFVYDIEDSEYDIVREAYEIVGLPLDG